MNLIVIFDLITFCTSLAALIILLIGWKRTLSRDVKLLTAGLFVFTLFYSFCLTMEWSGITKALDPFEDLIGALIPMWWAFIFYSFLQQIYSLDLRQSEERYRDIVEGTDDLITRVNKDGKFIFVNYISKKIFGLSPQDCVGMSAFDFIHPDDKEHSHNWFNDIVAMHKTSGTIENRQVNQNGKIHNMLWTSNFHYDSYRNLIGVSGIARDITDRKQAEEEREQLINELQESLKEIKTLRGILPLCSFCKKIRDDKGYWEQVDVYIYKYSPADISHSICPDCAKEHYPDLDMYDD
ncbi:PAS domain S-box protein [Thermodesulfobacteriota bacterium]